MPVTQEHLDQVVEIARRHGADRVLLFGSAVDDPERARDIDIAVGGVKGWEFYGMVGDMLELLPVPVDVIDLDSKSEFVRLIKPYGRMLMDRTHETA
jgi:predicted nucleotidyltransferase